MDAWLDTTRGLFKSSPKPFLRDSFWLLFITGITVSTIVGNLIIILAFLSNHGVRRCKSSRYINHYQEQICENFCQRFLLSLSVADFSLSVFVMAPIILNYDGWTYISLCKIWGNAEVLFSSASVYSMVGISIDRFFAVFFPIRYRASMSLQDMFALIFSDILTVLGCM